MPLYTFYPCQADDTALSFETYELSDDAEAALRARQVLIEHGSAQFVVVWCGERKVHTRYRIATALEALLSRPGAQPGTAP